MHFLHHPAGNRLSCIRFSCPGSLIDHSKIYPGLFSCFSFLIDAGHGFGIQQFQVIDCQSKYRIFTQPAQQFLNQEISISQDDRVFDSFFYLLREFFNFFRRVRNRETGVCWSQQQP